MKVTANKEFNVSPKISPKLSSCIIHELKVTDLWRIETVTKVKPSDIKKDYT